MEKLYLKLKNYNLKDAVYFEEQDRQFLALKNLYHFYIKKYNNNILNHIITNYLFLIIVNSLICYQLSGKGEDYWEEFSEALKNKSFNNFDEIYIFFENFLLSSKNNKRFINIKLKRIKKIEKFYNIFKGKEKYFYNNMLELRDFIAKIMNQKKQAKTIVFTIKMFSYGARNIFGFKKIPKEIFIPIDSRLENIYKKYTLKNKLDNYTLKDIEKFYIDLQKKLDIPALHLDAILWVNYDKILEDKL